MLNKLQAFVRRQKLLEPGDRVFCAVSGGADSVALLFALYLLRESLGIKLEAAHFNHRLRGEESDRDEAFVQALCHRFDIPLSQGGGRVTPGPKGLEAAAREARYAFFDTLPGKIATAHTADDNAETVLLHLIRGTSLKGLGGIRPRRGRIIRPLLTVTRQEILDFLKEYHLSFVNDSSNDTDAFLRNRIRHHVMPLLRRENPRIGENLSAMALLLRQDEQALQEQILTGEKLPISALRAQSPSVRRRSLAVFLERCGVPEPELRHIRLAEAVAFSDNPSARADFPGGTVIGADGGYLRRLDGQLPLEEIPLPREGNVELPQIGIRVICTPTEDVVRERNCFSVCPQGPMVLRCRRSGDRIRLAGGTKSLKKLFIDQKIPQSRRLQIPVIADGAGILGVMDFGADLARLGPGVQIRFEKTENRRKSQ